MDVTSTGKLRRTLRAAAPPPRGGTRPRPTAAAPRALLALLTAATLLGAPGAAANSIDDLPMERLNVWIDRDEIQQFVGLPMDIFVVREGSVVPYLLDAYFDQRLPVLPPEVDVVRLTWQAKNDLYTYAFSDLRSLDPLTMYNPLLSIPSEGFVPRTRKDFQMAVACTGEVTAVASMYIVLQLRNSRGRHIPGSPIKLHLRKRCLAFESRTTCAHDCENGGTCGERGACVCPAGFLGDHCQLPVCFPNCENGGTCVSPHVCQCRAGYSGGRCQQAECAEACLHGGTCAHPDLCACASGFYGDHCQHVAGTCSIPCVNAGTCTTQNVCACAPGYVGEFCQTPICKKSCGVHGRCVDVNLCECYRGWRGRHCHKTVNRLLKEKNEPPAPSSHSNSSSSSRKKHKQKRFLRYDRESRRRRRRLRKRDERRKHRLFV